MNTVFALKGLDCPHCSAEIEKDVGKLDGIEYSSVNLMKQTLTVRTSDGYKGSLLEDIERIVHGHEPDVSVSVYGSADESSHHEEDEMSEKAMIIRLIAGAVIYAAGLVMHHLSSLPFAAGVAVLVTAYVILGWDVVFKALKNILKGRVFDENFLMSVSTVGAFVIGEYPEAVAVMLFYQVGELFQSAAVKKSRRSISELMDIRPDFANVKRDGELLTVSPEQVNRGEIIVVKAGEKIPLDGVVVSGSSALDTKALTGESLPREVTVGDSVLSGCINQSGVLTVKVTNEYGESTAAKILDLVENASARKAPAENFITKFARFYTPAVVILAVLLSLIPPLVVGGGFTRWIRRSFVFLVISCPCALVISIPLTFFGGIGSASRKGILVKGGNFLEALNSVETIVFDKTGTLTKGSFKVTKISPAAGFDEQKLITLAAYAECMSNHPIALSVVSAYGRQIDRESICDFCEISGQGISVTANGDKILAGNAALMKADGIAFEQSDEAGTKIYIAKNGSYAGFILISDELKPDSKAAIAELKRLGIKKTVMLTGDNEKIAEAVAKEIGIDEYHSELLPSDKVSRLEMIDKQKSVKGKIAFVGDGINDAPVLARADIGIAMGALGCDAAIEAADVVLMTDEPSRLADAIRVARATKAIVMQNIIFALGVKAALLILGALGIAGMWLAVFGDVGVAVIAILNAMRILRESC